MPAPDHLSAGPVLVTGGSSGLGAAVVTAVDKAGGTPVVLDVREPADGVPFEQVDLSDSAAAAAAVDRVVAGYGDLAGVVTAAGSDACGALEEVPAEAWEQVIAVNLLGTAATVRAALPSLRRTGGRVVTVASTLGLRALPNATAYCASKFGIIGFSRALAAELAGDVGVTTLVPGGMRTAFFDGRPPEYLPGPDAQLNDPADVAQAVLFALGQPAGCEIRELVVAPSTEPSWP